jgi:hypothetical protein
VPAEINKVQKQQSVRRAVVLFSAAPPVNHFTTFKKYTSHNNAPFLQLVKYSVLKYHLYLQLLLYRKQGQKSI